MIVLCVVVTVAAHSTTLPVIDWAKRVVASEDQPVWKKSLASKALSGNVSTMLAKTTRYSDKNYLDPFTGGGPDGCTWTNPDGHQFDSVRLRYGYVAADTRHHPTGTVMFAGAPYNRTWIVVDCGPGVKGRRHIDVYHSDRATWNWYAKNVNGPVKCWVLGRITRAQAQM